MQVFKNLKIIICVLALMSFITSVANSTERVGDVAARKMGSGAAGHARAQGGHVAAAAEGLPGVLELPQEAK